MTEYMSREEYNTKSQNINIEESWKSINIKTNGFKSVG